MKCNECEVAGMPTEFERSVLTEVAHRKSIELLKNVAEKSLDATKTNARTKPSEVTRLLVISEFFISGPKDVELFWDAQVAGIRQLSLR